MDAVPERLKMSMRFVRHNSFLVHVCMKSGNDEGKASRIVTSYIWCTRSSQPMIAKFNDGHV